MNSPALSHPKFKLGLKPRDPSRVVVRLHWRDGVVPVHPRAVDRLTGWTFDMGANDRFGTCGPTSVANHREMSTKFLSGTEDETTLDEVFALYRESGNPSFDPRTGRGDDGVDNGVMMAALQAHGLGDGRVFGYALLADTSDASINCAIDRFGGVIFAVDLEVAQQNQTDQGLWDYSRSSPWGGHDILAAAYDEDTGRADVVTWAKRVGTTQAFRRYQLSEVWVILWNELLTSPRLFDSGIDLQQLARDYEALTGRPFPAVLPTPPPPEPYAAGSIVIDLAAQSVTLPKGWTASGPDVLGGRRVT